MAPRMVLGGPSVATVHVLGGPLMGCTIRSMTEPGRDLAHHMYLPIKNFLLGKTDQ